MFKYEKKNIYIYKTEQNEIKEKKKFTQEYNKTKTGQIAYGLNRLYVLIIPCVC